ncbi:FAD-dependent oxidoreductase [Euzebya sp.]|uniref:oxidoreductase n=1 Tax=Euzebya sp. TaxID=1971409 RepID=UPI0035148C33
MADLFDPITVGTIRLDHRLVMPPHSGGRGALLGRPDQFERFCAYWVERVRGGVQWVGGTPTFVRNPLIPGFEPTGVGASGPGTFRQPGFVERLAEFTARLHAAGGWSTVQMVMQGGKPSAPSPRLSGYRDHAIPHALDADEVAWLVREYGESAALAAEGGADVIELHANHDDVLQWFLSPLTNHRDDGYGGSAEGRRRLLREVVESIRSHVDRPLTLGLRLCIDEMIDGGYGLEDCQALLAAFTADGTVDYFSLDVGNNWGAPSYVPPNTYGAAPWAELCGEARTATDLPVLYAGRVTDVATARRVVADGHADLVGMVRALIAEPQLLEHVRDGAEEESRPCIGVQDCLNRRVVEHLPFACAVNPHVGRETERLVPTSAPRHILVVGGGPAGTETAALAAERGHRVTVWEREDHLGGQLAVAARARMNRPYADWIDWQARRLDRLGVTVALGVEATADAVVAEAADVVVVATGARARRPDAEGLAQPHVRTAVDVLSGAEVGRRVLVVSEDDRPGPLAVADHLAGLGHEVVLTHRSPAPSPLVGAYALGAVLARLDRDGAQLIASTRLVAVDGSTAHVANTFSGRRWTIEGVDTVVLATGSVPESTLHDALRGSLQELHLLGDAYAPRRVVFATRQAYALVADLG